MNRAIARFMLLLLVLAGCETEKDPAEEPLDPSLLLTDGFCLLSKNRVVLMGLERYHYVTNGLFLMDESGQHYRNHMEHLSWDGADPDRMSLLKSDSSVILTILYEDFDELPAGSFDAYFEFPAPHFQAAREDLDLEDGRIWLGDLMLYSEVIVE